MASVLRDDTEKYRPFAGLEIMIHFTTKSNKKKGIPRYAAG
jgi:hypothetical protein